MRKADLQSQKDKKIVESKELNSRWNFKNHMLDREQIHHHLQTYLVLCAHCTHITAYIVTIRPFERLNYRHECS